MGLTFTDIMEVRQIDPTGVNGVDEIRPNKLIEDVPRLLYVADVPVECSHHGSALIYRLLQGYPKEKLKIVEAGLLGSQAERRLPGIRYHRLPIRGGRFLTTRFFGWVSSILSLRAPSDLGRLTNVAADFNCEAVVTVAHGFSWLTAAAYARRRRIPLHLIIHDDWLRLMPDVSAVRRWVDRQFAKCYREAASRLCVSPGMVEDYMRRYGVKGSVLYPSRSNDCPKYTSVSPRVFLQREGIVIGYGGNSSPDVISGLTKLAQSARSVDAELCIFGPFTTDQQSNLKAIYSKVTFKGLMPYKDMIRELRDKTDILFVPMPFDDSRRFASLGFPSKLADYTAIGLPILIHGPVSCSATKWAREHAGVAEVIDTEDPNELTQALNKLISNPKLRAQLASSAMRVGEYCFDHTRLQRHFIGCLQDTFIGVAFPPRF